MIYELIIQILKKNTTLSFMKNSKSILTLMAEVSQGQIAISGPFY